MCDHVCRSNMEYGIWNIEYRMSDGSIENLTLQISNFEHVQSFKIMIMRDVL